MKLDHLLNKYAIMAELAKLNIGKNCKINADGTVDVSKSVVIPTGYDTIPVQFGTVDGDFRCKGLTLKSLKGAPAVVNGDFICIGSGITSLQFAPRHVDGNFYCNDTNITSLMFAPQRVGGHFSCDNTRITTLHNIHKTHSNWVMGGKLYLPDGCTHILGLAYVLGVKSILVSDYGNGHDDAYDIEVIHDVFLWQEKLLDLGLIRQAQL
jgi:hypothetical protein